LQKALDFENAFKRLKEYTDPVGAAVDTTNAEFKKLKATFEEAGASAAEYADLEKLYGLERAKAVKAATDQILGSLQSLQDQLTVGNSALSLRDREAMAKATYQPLADRVKAGDSSAYDDYAKAAQQLLDIERQLNGSQSDYFALQDEIASLTKARIAAETAKADAATNRDNPFSAPSTTGAKPVNDNAGVASAINSMSANLLNGLGFKLDAVNQNLGSVIKNLGSLVDQGSASGASSPSYSGLLRTASW
jgi:chromosome segregation ATPase